MVSLWGIGEKMKIAYDEDGDKYVETTDKENKILSDIRHPKHWDYNNNYKRLDGRCKGKSISRTPEEEERLKNVKNPEELEKLLNEIWNKNNGLIKTNKETVNKKHVPKQKLTVPTSKLSKMQRIILELTTKIELVNHDGDQIWYDRLLYATYHNMVNKNKRVVPYIQEWKERVNKKHRGQHKLTVFKASFSRSLHRLKKRGLIEFYFESYNKLRKYPDGIKPQVKPEVD